MRSRCRPRRCSTDSNSGGTILLTTHYLEEAEALASRVVVINKGRSIFAGSIDAIKARIGVKRLKIRGAVELPIAGIAHSERDGDRCVLRTKNVDELMAALLARGVRFDDIEIHPISLEEAFLDLTERTS
jgi:ABC-2 type transport system ATP-binding protein